MMRTRSATRREAIKEEKIDLCIKTESLFSSRTDSKNKPSFKRRYFILKRQESAKRFLNKANRNPSAYGPLGSEVWMNGLLAEIGEPDVVLAENIQEWMEKNQRFFGIDIKPVIPETASRVKRRKISPGIKQESLSVSVSSTKNIFEEVNVPLKTEPHSSITEKGKSNTIKEIDVQPLAIQVDDCNKYGEVKVKSKSAEDIQLEEPKSAIKDSKGLDEPETDKQVFPTFTLEDAISPGPSLTCEENISQSSHSSLSSEIALWAGMQIEDSYAYDNRGSGQSGQDYQTRSQKDFESFIESTVKSFTDADNALRRTATDSSDILTDDHFGRVNTDSGISSAGDVTTCTLTTFNDVMFNGPQTVLIDQNEWMKTFLPSADIRVPSDPEIITIDDVDEGIQRKLVPIGTIPAAHYNGTTLSVNADDFMQFAHSKGKLDKIMSTDGSFTGKFRFRANSISVPTPVVDKVQSIIDNFNRVLDSFKVFINEFENWHGFLIEPRNQAVNEMIVELQKKLLDLNEEYVRHVANK